MGVHPFYQFYSTLTVRELPKIVKLGFYPIVAPSSLNACRSFMKPLNKSTHHEGGIVNWSNHDYPKKCPIFFS
jgi:hypothetical protein